MRMSFLNPAVESELRNLLGRFDCQAGSVHVLSGEQLFLVAAVGIPGQVLQMISVVPVGKGMAGLAAERKETVQVCNLQADDSGVVQPGAKATGMEGSIALPMWMKIEGKKEVKGVLGVAKTVAHQYSDAEIQNLLKEASLLAEKL